VRYSIIELLKENDMIGVGQMAVKMNLTQPEMSGHLNLMYNYRLVLRKRVGKTIVYSANWELLDYISDFTDKLHNR
jgi:DNA-binding transcriptional ArsR family regulator